MLRLYSDYPGYGAGGKRSNNGKPPPSWKFHNFMHENEILVHENDISMHEN